MLFIKIENITSCNVKKYYVKVIIEMI